MKKKVLAFGGIAAGSLIFAGQAFAQHPAPAESAAACPVGRANAFPLAPTKSDGVGGLGDHLDAGPVLRCDGFYVSVSARFGVDGGPVPKAYEYLKFRENGLVSWAFGPKDLPPDSLMEVFARKADDPGSTGRYTVEGHAVKFAIPEMYKLQANGQVGEGTLALDEKFDNVPLAYSQQYRFQPAPEPSPDKKPDAEE